MLAGVIFLSSELGLFSSGSGEMGKLFSNEFARLSENAAKQYGVASVQVTRMSEQLSAVVADFSKREKITPIELKSRPELLESLQLNLLFVLMVNLYSSELSGAFVTLDTTVNPSIRGAENSKSGIYIRNIEPNIGGTGTEMRYLLRGFPSLVDDNYINYQAKWDLEFNVKDQLFWMEPIKAYVANPSMPLSRSVYWCSMSPIQGLNESVMICSVPVLDDNRNILGVCGLEISEMNFMLRHEPGVSGLHHSVFLFSSESDGKIQLGDALFSGNNAVYDALRRQGSMSVIGNTGEFFIYTTPDSASFMGMNKAIQLYPNDSPFNAGFAATLVVPSKEFNEVIASSRLRLILTCAFLLCVGVTLSLYFSDRYEKPFRVLLETLRSGDMNAKSSIPEINDLLEFMRSQLKETGTAGNGIREGVDEFEKIMGRTSEESMEQLLDSFLENTKKLSRAEADVFYLYIEGHNAQEIALMLNLSLNTIKTHNKRIFAKLNVSSRKELLTWVQVLSSSGCSLDDSRQKQFDKIRNIVRNMNDNS